jgi:NAD(P)-dependent dehydrogenase (short-subunit alcohol dehydrogenase family)
MPSSTGTVLITGANGGLGSAFVSQFLKSPQAANHTGLFAVRNPSTATTLEKVVSSTSNSHSRHEIISLDLSNLASVRAGAKAINERIASGALPPIRALVLNAAIQHTRVRPSRTMAWSRILVSTTFPISSSCSFFCKAWTKSLGASSWLQAGLTTLSIPETPTLKKIFTRLSLGKSMRWRDPQSKVRVVNGNYGTPE